MKRILRAVAMAVAATIAAGAASLRAETLIIAAGGWVGPWDTEIEMANTEADPIDVFLSVHGVPLGAPCPPACNGKTYTVPGNGLLRVLASDFLGELYRGPQMIRVETDAGVPAPVVHARSVSQASTAQFAELPVIREDSLLALDPQVLVLPGASRQGGIRSNVILESIGGGLVPTAVHIELFDAGGQLLGAGDFVVMGDATIQATTIVDVVGALGVSTLASGQVRVTKIAGPGVLWGVLATVVGEGSLKISMGANP